MKGNKKILVVALLLLLISVTFTTYAIYRNKYEGTGSLSTAKWNVTLKNGSDAVINTVTFDFDDIEWDSLTGYNDTIAPGSTGTIQYVVDANDSEVDVDVSASVNTSSLSLPTGFTITGVSSPAVISYGAADSTATLYITVAWEGADSDTDSKDTTDKAFNDQDLSIPVTIVAKQSLTSHVS